MKHAPSKRLRSFSKLQHKMGCISSRLSRTATTQAKFPLDNPDNEQPAIPFQGPSRRTRDGSWDENSYLKHHRKDEAVRKMADGESEIHELQEVHWSHERHELQGQGSAESAYPVLRSWDAPAWGDHTIGLAY